MPGGRGPSRKEECSGTGIGKIRRIVGERKRNSVQPPPFKAAAGANRSYLHTVRGRNDERYVIDRRDPISVFAGLAPGARHCLLSEDKRGGGEGWMGPCNTSSLLDKRHLQTKTQTDAGLWKQNRAELTKRKVIGTIEK